MKSLVLMMAICCTPAHGFEPTVELAGATAMSAGRCNDDGYVWECFAIIKGENKYLVMVDGKGIAKVYGVEDFKASYSTSDLKMVWQRIDV